ncbi:hypothetical protein [Algiphilus sp.]|uniref:hypothetical protein n=1 Tax=Algiphilus sp. TaxID=1872431 RepID=UPI0025C5E0B4|nr:hypothetical protein [Algiphilus sp.]MCK5770685.1 hypothetical protein [Algiphilus sp.]
MSNIDGVIAAMQEADQNLQHRLRDLTEDDKTTLYAYLSMFDHDRSGALEPHEVEDASDILRLVRHIDEASVRSLIALLKYIDFNGNATVDSNEHRLAVDIIGAFAGEEAGDSSTVNHDELDQAVRATSTFDRNADGLMTKDERRMLRDGLGELARFRELGKAT